MRNRYQLFCPEYNKQMWYSATRPYAVAPKLGDLKTIIEHAWFFLLSQHEWYVMDIKTNQRVDRETVLRVCGLTDACYAS